MKNLLIALTLLALPALMSAQEALPVDTGETENTVVSLPGSRELYLQILEDYVFSRRDDALEKIDIFDDLFPESEEMEKVTEVRSMIVFETPAVTPVSVDETAKTGNGTAFFWTWNMIYITGAVDMLPSAFGMEGAEIYAGFTLAGLGAGVVTSVLGTRNDTMTWGRAYAIDLYTLMGAFNMLAIDTGFFMPDQTADYEAGGSSGPAPVNSVLPNTIQQEKYTQFLLGTTSLAILGSRYAALFLTQGKDLSAGRYAFLYNGFIWSTALSSLMFSEIDYNRFVISDNPNAYNLLTSVIIGDAAVFGLNMLYDKLNWTAEQSWIVSSSGFTYLTAGLTASLLGYDWDKEHAYLYSSLWGISGLALGVAIGEYPEKYSPEKTLIKHGHFWTTALSTFFLSELNDDKSYNLLFSPFLGNTSAFLLKSNFDKLQWSEAHTRLVTLGGVVGGLSGWLVQVFFESEWAGEHAFSYTGMWCLSGLIVSTVATMGMPTADESRSDTDTLMGRLNNENVMVMMYPGMDAKKNMTINMGMTLNF